ncbi:MAG: SDR family oxidoreductase [Cyanobacteriota bacterium]
MKKLILITGATGYVGGLLVKEIISKCHHYEVRCLARRPEYLKDKVPQEVSIFKGDILDPLSLSSALEGVHTAFYLVHSMGAMGSFEELDRAGAINFAQAASEAGVKRIIYLGGLGEGDNLSSHLKSRQEVGQILSSFGVQIIEFRASIIIGAGSLSFELVRALIEKIPLMLTPRWVFNLAQPIYVMDVIEYLLLSIELETNENEVFEIGGADAVSYGGIMQEYAKQRNLKRIMIPVPFLTPYLSSLWLGLITPIYARVGRKLIEGVRNSTVVVDNKALETFDIKPKGIEESIKLALKYEEKKFSKTYWADAVSSCGCTDDVCLNVKVGNRLIDFQKVKTNLSADKAFKPIQRIGGIHGWYYANFLWHIRGFIDLCVGGAGLRRGRRDPELIAVGDTIDWWRVEKYEPNKLLRLFSEMKIPGNGWLEFEVKEKETFTEISQSAIFYPSGLFGLLYWYALYPIHWFIFRGMIKNIKKAAEKDL